MIQLGDVVKRRVAVYDPEHPHAAPEKKTMEATVVYIHPERRFYTIECKMPAGRRFRETEYFYPRCGQMKN